MNAARRCALPALGAGAALTAMLFASRLPATLDFILPRRSGWTLFVFGFELLSRPAPRALFTAAVTLALVAALGRFGFLLGSAMRARSWSAKDFLSRGFRLALVLLLARWSFSIWFEASQKAWFPYGSLNVLEPLANFIFCSAVLWAAAAAALDAVAPKGSRKILVSWSALNALAAFLAFAAYGAWNPPAETEAGRRLFVVLTEEEGRPGQAAYDLPVKAERPLGTGVDLLPSLRALYEFRAKAMDPAGLRGALMLGVKHGDELARVLLLAHLNAAPPTPQALGALGALADETAHRIGANGASRIALTYAHLGDAAQAAVWAARAEKAPRGIPAGLLDLTGGGALKPGRVAGRIEGVLPARIGLYRKSDAAAPYLLDAGALSASTALDAKGRFSFEGLSAGRYYLAFAFEPREAVNVSGHRGDLVLDAKRAAVEAGPFTIRASR